MAEGRQTHWLLNWIFLGCLGSDRILLLPVTAHWLSIDVIGLPSPSVVHPQSVTQPRKWYLLLSSYWI